MEQICLHETAHLARYDDWSLLLERTMEAVFVFHPVVRWIARQIDLEREIACDDFVISATGQPRPYASCLTHVAELAAGHSSSPLAAAVVDESSHLTRRIRTLLDKTRRTGTSILKIQLTAAVLALCLLTWLAAKSPALFALATPQPASQSVVANVLDAGHTSNDLQSPYPTATARLIQIPPAPQTGLNLSPTAVNDVDAHSAISQATIQRPEPDWETKAGGQATFEIASVAEDNPPLNQQPAHSNMGRLYDANDDSTPPAGGLFSVTNVPLFDYISFAYKLSGYEGFFVRNAIAQVSEHRYDIHAGTHGNPTKDQFRLMVQALLADRFKLAVHWETQQLPVFALLLDKPGTLGPHLRPHSDDASCSIGPAEPDPAPPTVAGGFPKACGTLQSWTESGRFYVGGRNINMEQIASHLNLALPALDKTGLTGKYDFVFEYASFPPPSKLPLGTIFQTDPQADSLEAQLGLKLERTTGPVAILVVDHIEEPTPIAQAPAIQTPAPMTTEPPVPQLQAAASGRIEFDFASVKPNIVPPRPNEDASNVPLGDQDSFRPTGGLFSARNQLLSQYMVFAYKLNNYQAQLLSSQLPEWANTERYDIQARAAGNPTKDQYRSMVQALLVDRFKLTFHHETRQLPVFAMVLDKRGKLGPQIRPHPEDALCNTTPPPPMWGMLGPPLVEGGYPEICRAYLLWFGAGRLHAGGRNVPLYMIANRFTSVATTSIDRPVLDKTGLSGGYDFLMDWTPTINGPLPPGVINQYVQWGPSFMEALKKQLGFKLVPQTGPVDVFFVDHIEAPSPDAASMPGQASSGKTESTQCPVTLPRYAPDPPGEHLFGSRAAAWSGNLFVGGLWRDGTVVVRPNGPGSIHPDGSMEMKFGWYRIAGLRGRLTIEGKRLDAPAPPLSANIPDGYSDTGFQATGIIFPTEGCWEVTGKVANTKLTFVTRIVKAAQSN